MEFLLMDTASARQFVVALQAIGVDQWAELGLVLTSLFVTQLKIEQARCDTLVLTANNLGDKDAPDP